MKPNGKQTWLARMKPAKRNEVWLALSQAADEIRQALNISYEPAYMTLHGLCATGNVRSQNNEREIIDTEDYTVSDFEGSPAFVSADDVRHWLARWSRVSSSHIRDQIISKLLSDGLVPPRAIKWKPFCDRVRNDCNGWLGDRPALGFSDKQIQRAVKELRTK